LYAEKDISAELEKKAQNPRLPHKDEKKKRKERSQEKAEEGKKKAYGLILTGTT